HLPGGPRTVLRINLWLVVFSCDLPSIGSSSCAAVATEIPARASQASRRVRTATRNRPVPAPRNRPQTVPRPKPNSVGSTLAAPLPTGECSHDTNDGASRPTAAPTIPPATPDAIVQAIT